MTLWVLSIITVVCQWTWPSLVAQTVKNPPAMWENWVWSLDWEDPLEKRMATLSSILAWRIPWKEELGRLQSKGLQRARHDWATKTRLQPVSHRIDSTEPQNHLYCIRETNFSVWDCSRLMTKNGLNSPLFFYPHLCYMPLNFLSRSEIYFPTPGIQVGLMI